MEFADGETLAERLARGPMPVCDVLPIARQIAEALEAAHEKGIIHRDLKRYKKGRPCCGGCREKNHGNRSTLTR